MKIRMTVADEFRANHLIIVFNTMITFFVKELEFKKHLQLF